MSDTIGRMFKTDSPTLLDPERMQAFIAAHNLPTSFVFPDTKTLVGIEVEVENILTIDPNLTLGFWKIDEDGSLRNNGREFISYPISSNYIQPALVHLFQCLNKDIDFSKRTSIHIHLNARTFDLENLASFLFTYLTMENILFKYADLNRRSNIFCVPLLETNLLDYPITDWKNRLFRINETWHKYTALNLLPITEIGTIEFRHMPGTSNLNKLFIWIALIQKLKLYSFKMNMKDVLKRITELNTNSQYHMFVQEVFGDYYHYLDTTNLKMDMERGVTMVKSCGLNNDYHQVVCANRSPDSALYKAVLIEYMKVNQSTPKAPKSKRSASAIAEEYITSYEAIQPLLQVGGN